jgi:hypothetical protein
MWSAGSSPAYSGRIWRIRSFNVVIEYSHPILSAMTVAHPWEIGQQLPHVRLDCIDQRAAAAALVLRRPVRRQRRPHGVARDA